MMYDSTLDPISPNFQPKKLKSPDRSKWDVLVERQAALRKALAKADAELEWMTKTPCPHSCTGCGEDFKTEADFFKHYLITDERYLNLGYCPIKDKKD
jgi:hypothetical protein